jgi:hypothetical protein
VRIFIRWHPRWRPPLESHEAMGAAAPLYRPPVAFLLLFNALVLWAGEQNRPAVLSLARHSLVGPCTQLRLRGGRGDIDQDSANPGLADWSAGVNAESSEVSGVTGMVSTIFFSSSEGSEHDMSLPQVLPVSDIASRSLDRDYKEFVEDQYLPPLTREWAGDLPRTGRQYLRHVRREAALNYMPVRPLVTKRIIDPRDYVPAALADSYKDSLDSDLAAAGDRQGCGEGDAQDRAGGARPTGPGTDSEHARQKRHVDAQAARVSQDSLRSVTPGVPDGWGKCGTGEVEAGWPVLAPQDAGGSEKGLTLKAAEWARNYTESYLLSARGSSRGERTPRVVYSRRLHGPPAPFPVSCCQRAAVARASWLARPPCLPFPCPPLLACLANSHEQ